LRLVDNQRDAAGDQIAGRASWIDFDQVYGEGDMERAQHQPARDKVHVTQRQVSAVPDRIEVGPVGPISHQRSVMAVDQRDRLGQ
jgi:hypothetical protein